MPMPEGFTAVAVTREAKKKLKHISAEREQPMCGILSAMIDYMANSPEFLTALLHPAQETSTHAD